MRVLFITGRLAEGLVRRAAEEAGLEDFGVLALGVDVAAFLSAEALERALPELAAAVRGYDLVVVPGFARGDFSGVARALGVKVVKGPRYAQDIPAFVEALRSGVEFSPSEPADRLIERFKREREARMLRELEEAARSSAAFFIGSGGRAVPVSRLLPAVIAEIPWATLKAPGEIELEAARLAEEGADVVSLGGAPGREDPEAMARAVRAAASSGRPVAVDTTSGAEVEAALAAGADLVLAPTAGVAELVARLSPGTPVVVVPRSRGRAGERVAELTALVSRLRSLGLGKVIADPVLDPPLMGLAESLAAYRWLREADPSLPLLMGAGNVTELLDADSHGVNALLACLAAEMGVELLLTTEASPKTRGSARELSTAARMCALAKREGRPPKDYSTNLLVLKNKRSREQASAVPPGAVEAKGAGAFRPDPLGYFRIWVDRAGGRLVAEHYRHGSSEPDAVIVGRDPMAVGRKALEMSLVGQMDHALYLGAELEKAWLALRLGRDYVQDEELL